MMNVTKLAYARARDQHHIRRTSQRSSADSCSISEGHSSLSACSAGPACYTFKLRLAGVAHLVMPPRAPPACL